MQDFSTTQDVTDPVARCPSNCDEAMNLVMEDVNRITRVPDPLERNAAITQAYRNLGERSPFNYWIRLAGYVSTQGGCAMQQTQRFAAEILINKENALEALMDANTTIFSSVYPPNEFMQRCGFEKLKECNDGGAFEPEIDEDLMADLEALHNGNWRRAADLIAVYEQMEVVQPVYERHSRVFNQMENADNWVPGDQTSIPVSYECTRDNLVSLGNLEIQNPEDRVQYYHLLMDRTMQIEGLR